MVHVYRITAGLLLYLVLIYSCRTEQKGSANAAPSSAPEPATFAELFPAEGFTPAEKQAYRAGAEARKNHLAEMEAARQKLERAAAEQPGHLAVLARRIQKPWADVVRTNTSRFRELKAMAAAAPGGEVPCDICDSHSYMPCLLCDGGMKCEECDGEGTRAHGELCSVCLGRDKCVLCSGFGKMLCPFCDDGMICRDHAPPRDRSWLDPEE